MAKKRVAAASTKPDERPVCFVIMPIAEDSARPANHFRKVYNQIFKPACDDAKYQAIRADDIRQTNDIHIDILDRIINAPMAICDLSGLNPNVMFELGIRQAFNKPVVLVREVGTKNVFDIGSLRYTEYRKERIHDELIEDVDNLRQAIEATRDAEAKGVGINSIVRLLSVAEAASIPKSDKSHEAAMFEILRSEIANLGAEMSSLRRSRRSSKSFWIDSSEPAIGLGKDIELSVALKRMSSTIGASFDEIEPYFVSAIERGYMGSMQLIDIIEKNIKYGNHLALRKLIDDLRSSYNDPPITRSL